MIGITKFNPLRAKADSFGFRRGYFLKSKKMELAEVKKYFENADLCLANFGNEFRMTEKNFKSIHQDENEFYVNNGQFQIYSEEKGFAKILTTKEPSFSISKDQLRQLTDPKVKEWFPEVFSLSKDFTGWVRTNSGGNKKYLVLFKEGILQYGFDGNGTWFDCGEYKAKISEDLFEATNEEVFEALKNESVKGGFIEGVLCKWDDGGIIKVNKLRFEDNKLWCNDDNIIMDENGKWATIIKTITKSEAEKLLNKKIID